MTKKEIILILLGFFIWRLLIAAVTWLSPNFLPYTPSFPYSETLATFQLPQPLTAPGNFDGVHYLTIIQKGYEGTGLIQAFFPLYPLLATVLNHLIQNPLLSTQILSNLFALAFVYIAFYFLKKTFSGKIATWFLIIFALFPTSFYLTAVYTESLFLLLLFLAFILYQKKAWPWLALTLIALTATRITGIILIPVLLITWFIESTFIAHQKISTTFKQQNFWRGILSISVGAAGLIFYMIYLGLTFGQPLLFFQVQDQFGASRQTNLVLLPQVIWRYLKIFQSLAATDQLFNFKTFIYIQEFALSILAAFILLWQFLTLKIWQPLYHKFAFTKKILPFITSNLPLEIILFSLGAYLLPTLTGNFSSMPRYILLCPAIFIFLAQLKSLPLKIIWLIISALLLVTNLILFTQGFWVA